MTNTSKYFVLFILSLLDDILTLYYSFTTWAPIRARRCWFLFRWYALPVIRRGTRSGLIAAGGLILAWCHKGSGLAGHLMTNLALLSYSAGCHLASSARAGWTFRQELISEWA